jgi:hypothetical protein
MLAETLLLYTVFALCADNAAVLQLSLGVAAALSVHAHDTTV